MTSAWSASWLVRRELNSAQRLKTERIPPILKHHGFQMKRLEISHKISENVSTLTVSFAMSVYMGWICISKETLRSDKKMWKPTVFQWKYPWAKGGLYRLYFNKQWHDWLEFPTYFPPFPKGNTWNDSSYVAFGEIDGWYFAGGTQLGCSMHTVLIHRLHRIHDDRVYVRL